MPRQVTVAATQMTCSADIQANIHKAEQLVREAAKQGAEIILLQELFETPYFCKKQIYQHLKLATRLEDNLAVQHFQKLAAELQVVLPISFYELAGQVRFNSLVVIDADGSLHPNTYRKTHIPDGPGYSEKFYFSPGDTGFQVWNTRYAKIGVGICWDQWFPETARALALQGAEVIFYPTAIGNEPQDPTLDSCAHWQLTQQGHAAANLTPVVVSNRVGVEKEAEISTTFYGASFITDGFGAKIAELDREEEGVIVATFDLEQQAFTRQSWGVFRDRRPDRYHTLLTKDGKLS